jgi:hypothetical protein
LIDKTRSLLAVAGCVTGLAILAPAALAQEPLAADSPIQADEGQVLAETVRPETSPAGEQTCSAPALSNPLAAFKDRRNYFLAPAANFEDPALPGWELTGGASVTADASGLAVTADSQTSSLSLPPGSSATSPEMCVDLDYPTFRFFVSQLAADTDSELAVDVIYPGLSRNNVREARKFKLKAKDGWKLSDDVKLEPQRLGKRWGWRRVALRFRNAAGAHKPGSYRIDDILVDPRLHN